MDDAAALQRTLRRCTAVVVGTVALTGMTLTRPDADGLLLLLVLGALLYLALSPIVTYYAADETDDIGTETAEQ